MSRLRIPASFTAFSAAFSMFFCAVLLLAAARPASAQDTHAGKTSSGMVAAMPPMGPAATPPMGWNSWDSWGFTITQQQFERTADYMHQHLQKYGWQYMVIDEGWFAQYPTHGGIARETQGYVISPDGLYMPAPNRFPQGLKGVADYVHSLGLKFGIHIVHGIPRSAVEKNLPIAGSHYTADEAANTSDVCAWNTDNYGIKDNAAGQAYYDSMLKLYASWGLDFLKVDCISSPYNAAEIHMIHRAIEKTGRPIVLSLSPGPTPLKDGPDVEKYGNMWRISNDMWDVWYKPESAPSFPQALTRQFGQLARWTPYRGPGHWPDADMLPIGTLEPHPGWGQPRVSRLTHTEERTLVSLWSMARSPLIMGGNLLRMDPYTLSLLTDPEVIAIDQHSGGNHAVHQDAQSSVWTAEGAKGTYVGVFSLEDTARTMTVPFSDVGVHGRHRVRDLWARRNLGRKREISVKVPAHGCRLLLIQQSHVHRWTAVKP